MQTVHDIFFKMEEQEDLFNLQLADGTYYWDIVRREMFAALNAAYQGTYKSPQSICKNRIITVIKDIVKAGINELSLMYLTAKKPVYIFTTFQRHKRGIKVVDYITDHLYDLVSNDSICIEHINKSSISYLNIFMGRNTRVPPVNIRLRNEDIDVLNIEKAITTAVSKYFNFSIDIYDVVNYPIQTFKENRNYYRRLFSKFLPKAVICSNDGSLKGLYFAAKEVGVPAIELQHGASPGSILWTYPEKYKSPLPGFILPVAFLTFSNYWSDITKFPVKWMSSIGNNNFYQPPVPGGKDIVIVSNINTHKIWLDLVLNLADLVEGRKIYYKLHPQHFHLKEDIINEFQEKSNVVVITNEIDLTEVFQLCNHVVGMRSTMIYSALQAGKNVYLFKRSNYDWDVDIFKYLELFNDASELNNLIENTSNKNSKSQSIPPMFFEKFNSQQFMQLLDDIGSS